uniref:S27A2 synthetase n=1 Tax=Junco hyemalis TaxID=40217 RepID=A0A8C5IJB3_JUNHY
MVAVMVTLSQWGSTWCQRWPPGTKVGDAVPPLCRPQDALQVTGTFKQCKTQLVQEGFDPGAIGDRLFVRDAARRSYVPLSRAAFRDIQQGRLPL